MSKNYYIPKHLDEPFRFLFWTLPEAMIMALILFLGFALHQVMMGLLFAVMSWMVMRKLKSKIDTGIVARWIYWHFPHSKDVYGWFPPSHIREYLG